MRSRPNIPILAVLGTVSLLAVVAISGVRAPSAVKDDERVVLFPSVGTLAPDGETWVVPIHGWIFEPTDSVVRAGLIEEILEECTDRSIDAEERARFERRVAGFLVDNERGKRIAVEVAGRTVVLPASRPNGHFRGEVRLAAGEAIERAPDGILALSVRAANGRVFRGRARLLPPTGVAVISDLDDTVKVSEVADRGRLIARTFFEEFEAVPGMAELFATWRARGASFHFVSSSPWNLAESLLAFLADAGFPVDTIDLKDVRLKDGSFLDLFASGSVTKPRAIEARLAQFPRRSFILVGDTGEEDPEVYAALLRSHSEQVVGVALRNVTGARRDDARFAHLFEGIDPERWVLFDDPALLTDHFAPLRVRPRAVERPAGD